MITAGHLVTVEHSLDPSTCDKDALRAVSDHACGVRLTRQRGSACHQGITLDLRCDNDTAIMQENGLFFCRTLKGVT